MSESNQADSIPADPNVKVQNASQSVINDNATRTSAGSTMEAIQGGDHTQSNIDPTSPKEHIALIGVGTIGASFATLHILRDPHCHITIYDPAPSIGTTLPLKIQSDLSTLPSAPAIDLTSRLTFAPTLSSAVSTATIIQEQGPESPAWKTATWAAIEASAPPTALFWSSTSGIPASVQSRGMRDPHRLIVVHPYNPPLLMPLIEVVPGPGVPQALVDRTMAYWAAVGKKPILIRAEVPGFVSNRLAFALLREAVGLVRRGVIGVEELDALVETSMGPRWAVAGPFKSYHAGGGEGGMKAFLENIGGTIRAGWEDSDKFAVGSGEREWEGEIAGMCEEAFGEEAYERRKGKLAKVLEQTEDVWQRPSS
ncbi:hypothetical protein B9Z65_6564 [Elsinoe australis]|uniref:Uncharacterized protein n=1 Tax=Elsinoe australis TaxID=40998 RepID=A0A2P8A900_9PEZI|nr:hypothetical protein B9Z65_6564 [Elsinoe australis]